MITPYLGVSTPALAQVVIREDSLASSFTQLLGLPKASRQAIGWNEIQDKISVFFVSMEFYFHISVANSSVCLLLEMEHYLPRQILPKYFMYPE